MAGEPTQTVRLDRWLIAARLYKTRPLAQEACDGGHVTVNDRAAAPARAVKSGDLIEALTPGGKLIVRVVALGERRGTAEYARGLYDDLTPVVPPPDEAPVTRERGAGRPTKRDARVLRDLRGR